VSLLLNIWFLNRCYNFKMNYPSCFYGGDHCADFPYWLIFLISGLLVTFVSWNFFRYRNKEKRLLIPAKIRKEIFYIVAILMGGGIFIPWVIDLLF